MKPIYEQYSADEMLRLIRTKKSGFWSRVRETRPLELFHEAARRVPAYKDFLKKNRIQPSKIKTFSDFQLVPPVDKKNYLRQYPLEKLCWDGTLKKPLVFTSTSGSTGEPFYFPRDQVLDWQSAVYHEMFLQYNPASRKKSTLVVIGFGMGVWIGGLITYEAFARAANKGYPITIVTAGNNKKEIFEAFRHLGDKFDQVILCGYPPFVKDVIDEGVNHGVHWHKLNLRIVFAAEIFSEKFRDYILKKTITKNKYTSTMNIYGSADLGTMAQETPLSILLRRIAIANPKVLKSFFQHAHRLPTLVQYNPFFITFEGVSGQIFCTANNALPLVRYAIGDYGDVFSFDDASKSMRSIGITLSKEVARAKITGTISELPFVYIYERTDMSTKLYGAIIYPEHVKEGLHHRSLEKYVTGKFTMATQYDQEHNQRLEINVELRSKSKFSNALRKKLEYHIHRALLEKNAEHRNNYSMMPEKVNPRVVLWRHEHPRFFRPGIKQKWVQRNEKQKS